MAENIKCYKSFQQRILNDDEFDKMINQKDKILLESEIATYKNLNGDTKVFVGCGSEDENNFRELLLKHDIRNIGFINSLTGEQTIQYVTAQSEEEIAKLGEGIFKVEFNHGQTSPYTLNDGIMTTDVPPISGVTPSPEPGDVVINGPVYYEEFYIFNNLGVYSSVNDLGSLKKTQIKVSIKGIFVRDVEILSDANETVNLGEWSKIPYIENEDVLNKITEEFFNKLQYGIIPTVACTSEEEVALLSFDYKTFWKYYGDCNKVSHYDYSLLKVTLAKQDDFLGIVTTYTPFYLFTKLKPYDSLADVILDFVEYFQVKLSAEGIFSRTVKIGINCTNYNAGILGATDTENYGEVLEMTEWKNLISDNNFTDEMRNQIHSHLNQAILDNIKQEDIDKWNTEENYGIELTEIGGFQGINKTQHLGGEEFVDSLALTEGSFAIGNETIAGRRGFKIQYGETPLLMYGVNKDTDFPAFIRLTDDGDNSKTKEELEKLVIAAEFTSADNNIYTHNTGINFSYTTKSKSNKSCATLVVKTIIIDECKLANISYLNSNTEKDIDSSTNKKKEKEYLNYKTTSGYSSSDPNHRFTFSIWANDYPEIGTKSIAHSSISLNKETKATGDNTFAVGKKAEARGDYSSAFGTGTVAGQENQSVRGKYNKIYDLPTEYIDENGKWTNPKQYLDIVGNGTSKARSNAYELDSSGNGYFAGNVYRNGNKRLIDIDEFDSYKVENNTKINNDKTELNDRITALNKSTDERLDKLEAGDTLYTNIPTITNYKGDLLKYTANEESDIRNFPLQLSNIQIAVTDNGRYTELHTLSDKENECLNLKNKRYCISYITPEINGVWYKVELLNVNFNLGSSYCYVDTNNINNFESKIAYKYNVELNNWTEIEYTEFANTYSGNRKSFVFIKSLNENIENNIPQGAGTFTVYEQITTNYEDIFIFDGIRWNKIYNNSPKGGASENRPSNPAIGQQYFDTEINKPIWYNGTTWVDYNGVIC